MSTIEDIARSVKSEMDSDVNLEIVAQFVSQRIQQVYAGSKFKSLRRYGELDLPAAIGSIDGSNGGTVTVTPGSNLVIGDATAASVWNESLAGWFFRVFPLHVWYRIAKFDPPATLTLDSPVSTERNPDFTLGTQLVGQSYYIVRRFIPIHRDSRYIGAFVLPRLYQPIHHISPEEMQYRYPSRYLVGPYPWCFSEFGIDWGLSHKPKIIEVYPYSLIADVISYTYWAQPPYLAFDEELPPTLDDYIAREMAMIPVYRYEYVRALKRGDVQGSALLKNEFRMQEAKMEVWKREALMADSGVEDITFIMRSYHSRRGTDWDPTTRAIDDVWLRRG